MSGSFALAATIVVGFGSAALGTIGTVAELAVKEIDKKHHPIIRTTAEVFAKTLQNAGAVFSLLILGSLVVTNPYAVAAVVVVGGAIVLTPATNGVIQHSKNPILKRIAPKIRKADQIASASAKTINTVVVTAAVFMSSGGFAAVIAGLGLTGLSIATYRKA